MDDSILRTVRKNVGPSEDYEYFDSNLIIHINSAFSRLCQLGVGRSSVPFKITGEEETWSDFIEPGELEDVKEYVILKVRLMFDPPANGTVINLYKEQIEKLEWLLRETARFGY